MRRLRRGDASQRVKLQQLERDNDEFKPPFQRLFDSSERKICPSVRETDEIKCPETPLDSEIDRKSCAPHYFGSRSKANSADLLSRSAVAKID